MDTRTSDYIATYEEFEDEHTRYKDSTYEIVSKVAYLCLSIRNCIKRAPKSTVPGQHRFGFEKPCFCSL